MACWSLEAKNRAEDRESTDRGSMIILFPIFVVLGFALIAFDLEKTSEESDIAEEDSR